MRKFRFYITSLMNGAILGTDSETTARDYAVSEDYFVVDTETGLWLAVDGHDMEVLEISSLCQTTPSFE